MDESEFQPTRATSSDGKVNRLPTDKSSEFSVVGNFSLPVLITLYPLLTTQCFLPLEELAMFVRCLSAIVLTTLNKRVIRLYAIASSVGSVIRTAPRLIVGAAPPEKTPNLWGNDRGTTPTIDEPVF